MKGSEIIVDVFEDVRNLSTYFIRVESWFPIDSIHVEITAFFAHCVGEGKKAAISKQGRFPTTLNCSYNVFSLTPKWKN